MDDNFYRKDSQEHLDRLKSADSQQNRNAYHQASEMGFIEAVKACFDKYAEFEGRSRRSEYWYFKLFRFIIMISLIILGLISSLIHEALPFFFMGLAVLFILGTFIPSLAVTVRRFHDAGQSGWLILLDVFCTSGIISIIFGCMESQPGNNQYGPNPKGIGNDW